MEKLLKDRPPIRCLGELMYLQGEKFKWAIIIARAPDNEKDKL